MSTDNLAYLRTVSNLVGEDDPLAILADTPSRIQALITGAEGTVLRQRPKPDKWSITEIVGHLADSELVFGFRLRMIFTVDGIQLRAFDPDLWASTFAYHFCDVHTSAELFSTLRMGNLRMLRQVATSLADNAEIAMGVIDNVDLRIGTILDVVPIPGANRLVTLIVDFGRDTRRVVAGIRHERDDPRILVGRQALFYYNVPSKNIRGQVSEAMLCDVGHADGIQPALLAPEWRVPNGTRAG
jgi:tRNA-binding protein